MESLIHFASHNKRDLRRAGIDALDCKDFALARVCTLLPLVAHSLNKDSTLGNIVSAIYDVAQRCNWIIHNSGYERDYEYITIRNKVLWLAKKFNLTYRRTMMKIH